MLTLTDAQKKLLNLTKAINVFRRLPKTEFNVRQLKGLHRERRLLLGVSLEDAHSVLYQALEEGVPSTEYDSALEIVRLAAETLLDDTRTIH